MIQSKDGMPVDRLNPLPTEQIPSPPLVYQNTTTGVSAINGDVIPMIDVSQCTDVTLHLTGTWSATVTFQASNDGTNWVSVSGVTVANTTASPVASTSTSNTMYIIATGFKYFRARATSYTSGTVYGVMIGNRTSTPMLTVGGSVSISGTPNVTVASKGSSGCTVTKKNADAGNALTSIKASGGVVFGIVASNAAAAARYVKFYNKASAPVVATDVPVITILVPAGSTISPTFAADVAANFSTGIAMAFTTGIADNDTGALAVNDMVVNVFWG